METAKRIIATIKYATLATVSADGQPWNSPVFALHDDDLNFYWASSMESQHSQNIRQTGKVFIVIYDSTAAPGAGEGVYIQAEAREIESEQDFEELKNINENLQSEKFLGESTKRFYKATPLKAWVNGEIAADGKRVDVRKQIL
jgi:general stress protein 26